jgi:hypothetical protein
MTKKDYQLIADTILEAYDEMGNFIDGENVEVACDGLDVLVEKITKALYLDNPKFNIVKFKSAIYAKH